MRRSTSCAARSARAGNATGRVGALAGGRLPRSVIRPSCPGPAARRDRCPAARCSERCRVALGSAAAGAPAVLRRSSPSAAADAAAVPRRSFPRAARTAVAGFAHALAERRSRAHRRRATARSAALTQALHVSRRQDDFPTAAAAPTARARRSAADEAVANWADAPVDSADAPPAGVGRRAAGGAPAVATAAAMHPLSGPPARSSTAAPGIAAAPPHHGERNDSCVSAASPAGPHADSGCQSTDADRRAMVRAQVPHCGSRCPTRDDCCTRYCPSDRPSAAVRRSAIL